MTTPSMERVPSRKRKDALASPRGASIPHASLRVTRRLGGLASLLLPIAVLVVWQVASVTHRLDQSLIPAPQRVVDAWWSWFFGTRTSSADLFTGRGPSDVIASARRVLLGFGIATLVAVPLGIAIGYWRVAERLIDPSVHFMRTIPVTAWVPFALILVGIQEKSSVLLVVLGAFFPIVVNATAGVRLVPSGLIRAALVLGANQRQLVTRVILRAALPSILTGMRLGLGVAWTAVIVSEMVAVRSGLGYVLWTSFYYFRPEELAATMATLGFLGWGSDVLMRRLTNRLVRWSVRT